jgi:hypothetical protein
MRVFRGPHAGQGISTGGPPASCASCGTYPMKTRWCTNKFIVMLGVGAPVYIIVNTCKRSSFYRKRDVGVRMRHDGPGLGGHEHEIGTGGEGRKMQRCEVDGYGRGPGGSYKLVQPNQPGVNWGCKETVRAVDEREFVPVCQGWDSLEQRIEINVGVLQMVVK